MTKTYKVLKADPAHPEWKVGGQTPPMDETEAQPFVDSKTLQAMPDQTGAGTDRPAPGISRSDR